MVRVWKIAIAITYGLILVQITLAIILNFLGDWRTWAVLGSLSVAAHLTLKLVEPAAPSKAPFERQPHDPAPRHVDGREWS